MPTPKPLILVTNDDGITSPGLRAAARAALPLGQVIVAAPTRQWSASGRSIVYDPSNHPSPYPMEVDEQPITAYQIDASPALVVARTLLALAPRRPDLIISGINYGENMGSDVTKSGTIGAALEGAAQAIPGLAVSLQTPIEMHHNHSDSVDFDAAVHFVRTFARWMLQTTLPFDVDILKIDIPDDATPETPWRLTRLSRHPYFVGALQQQIGPKETPDENPDTGIAINFDIAADYHRIPHPERTEPDSDIYALAVDRVVSVAPLSIDLGSRVDPAQLQAKLCGPT